LPDAPPTGVWVRLTAKGRELLATAIRLTAEGRFTAKGAKPLIVTRPFTIEQAARAAKQRLLPAYAGFARGLQHGLRVRSRLRSPAVAGQVGEGCDQEVGV